MPSPVPFKIIVYGTLAPETTPETAQFAAGLFIGYDLHARWTCTGPTADAAREKMETFWAKERKSHEPPAPPNKGAPAPGLEAPKAAPVVADDDEVL